MFSRKETINITKLKINISICNIKDNIPKCFLIKVRKRINNNDLRNTWYLKTAMIEKEWINNLKKDIWEGPKYLAPLIELISESFLIFLFTVPE